MESRDSKGELTIVLRDALKMYVTYLKKAFQTFQIQGARDKIAALDVDSNNISLLQSFGRFSDTLRSFNVEHSRRPQLFTSPLGMQKFEP